MTKLRGLILLLTVIVTLTACSAEETGPRVEIVALNHPPLRQTLSEIDRTLKPYKDKVAIQRVDAESDAGKDLLSNVGIEGHAALAILINGKIETELNGRTVRFEGFPNGASPVPDQQGGWTMEDLDKAVKQVAEQE